MPKIKEIYEANKDILTVIGINTEYAGKNNSWAATSERQGITWPNLNSPHRMSGEIASRFRLVAWPLQVLVSPEGVILDRWYGFGDGYLRMQIQKYIPELK